MAHSDSLVIIDKSRAVMWAILSGNVLSYCFIVISLLVKYWIK